MRDLYTLARKGSLYLLAGKLVTPIVGFLITVFIIRILSVKEYGIYNILLAGLSYIGLFSSLGLPSVFQRYLPEFSERDKTAALKELVRKGLIWRFVLASALILLVLLFSRFIGRVVHVEGYLNYFAVFSFAILFFLEAELLSIALTSLFMYKEFVISQLVYTLGRAALLYGLIQLGTGLVGLLVAEGLAYAVQLGIQAFYFRRFSRSSPGTGEPELPLRRLLRFGGYSYFNEMGSEVLNVSTDFFVISAFLGPYAVGLYAFADRVMTLLTRILPHSMLMDVIRPTFFAKYAQSGQDKDLVRMFNLVTKLIAFVSFPLVAGILILGDKLIVHLFNPKYLGGLHVLWIFAFFTAMNAFQFPLGLVTQSKERVEINFYSKIFAVYNLVLDLLVVKHYGILGVAIATSTAVLFKNLFIYVLANRHIKLSVDWGALGRIASNSVLMALVVYPFRYLVTDIYSFLLVTFLGGVFYLLVASLNKGFTVEEKAIVNRILRKPVFVF